MTNRAAPRLAALFAIVIVGEVAIHRAAASVGRFPSQPRPAVARVIVPEGNGATSYGSGTLIDVRDQYGLVITNWHVVRDAQGMVEVVFPNGFRSQSRPIKVDKDWDLAALVIWRPPISPVPIATHAPQPGDPLTICGYGQGTYREATGRCTQYLAPGVNFPREMVELNVEARQGDSGGPIFNSRDELAGVLFGASRGTTLGSFGGRVEQFVATLAPDIGDQSAQIAAVGSRITGVQSSREDPSAEGRLANPQANNVASNHRAQRSEKLESNSLPAHSDFENEWNRFAAEEPPASKSFEATVEEFTSAANAPPSAVVASIGAPPDSQAESQSITWREIAGDSWFQQGKTLFALLGVAAVFLQVVRWVA